MTNSNRWIKNRRHHLSTSTFRSKFDIPVKIRHSGLNVLDSLRSNYRLAMLSRATRSRMSGDCHGNSVEIASHLVYMIVISAEKLTARRQRIHGKRDLGFSADYFPLILNVRLSSPAHDSSSGGYDSSDAVKAVTSSVVSTDSAPL